MKNLPWIGIPVLGFLVVATQFPPTADVTDEALKYFSAEQIEEGQRFATDRRWIFWANALAQLALMVYLAFTPLGKRLYLATGAIVHGHWFTQLLLLGGIYFLASVAVSLPFRIAQFALYDSWGMNNLSFFAWLGDYLLVLVVTGLLEAVALVAFYAIVRALPNFWWIAAGAGAMVFGTVVAFIFPVVIAPLFNTLTPLEKSEWKTYEPRLREIGKRVEIPPSSIYVADASRQSNAGNAYYAGLGSSQRIVLYDTFLKKCSQAEVEMVVAHEMGHWWHQHIWQGILFGGLALTAGLYGLFRYLNWLVEVGVLRSAGDPAGVFRVILLANLALAITLPIQNGVSRIFERQADQTSLELTKKTLASNVDAFIAAEKNLAIQNKSNVAPSRLNVILFATHPPVVERIKMAEAAKQ